MQLLYGLDSQGPWPEPGPQLDRLLQEQLVLLLPEIEPQAREWALELVQGVVAHRLEIDRRLEQASRNWRVERMSQVDRNVLRVAVHELTGSLDVPRAVVLDEAIEIAKQYGSSESGAFVNGVLNRVAELLA